MNTFRFVLQPLTFEIAAHSSSPLEALEEVLKYGTDEEELLLEYLAREIDDHPTLCGSVTWLAENRGAFCYVTPDLEDEIPTLRAPIFFPVRFGPGL